LGITVLAGGLFGSTSAAGVGSTPLRRLPGTVPTSVPKTAQRQGPSAPSGPGVGARLASNGAAPIVGASWQGLNDPSLTPADPNGAIGPNSYVEIINEMLGIYQRNGTLIASATLHTLTGDNNFLGDPMVLWDPISQRFYYNVWDITLQTMQWGFSKDDHPTSIPGSFCAYSASFGYATSEYPDYPKLGQTKDFLLWIDKPQGSGPITTSPAPSNFSTGKYTDLRNQDGSQAFTPVPAMQVDPSSAGFVLTSSDIECPDICGTGDVITVHPVRPTPGNPSVPQVLVTGKSVTVPTYAPPPANAPQKGTSNLLETLDGRLEHAVSAIDPSIGRMVVWTGHAVASGSKTEFRWYEVDVHSPTHPTIAQSGTVSDPNLWVFDGALAPDRTVNPSGRAHGESIVIGFTTTSSTTFPAAQMVSKVGSGAQSAFVMVHPSPTFDSDFSCPQLPYNCRWGDYAGATPDPTASLAAAHGKVWLTNQWTNGTNQTWNWEALP
jgi:hypothetical protein